MNCRDCTAPATHYVAVIFGRILADPETVKILRALGYRDEDLEREYGTETESNDAYLCEDHKGVRLHPEGYALVEGRKATKLPA